MPFLLDHGLDLHGAGGLLKRVDEGVPVETPDILDHDLLTIDQDGVDFTFLQCGLGGGTVVELHDLDGEAGLVLGLVVRIGEVHRGRDYRIVAVTDGSDLSFVGATPDQAGHQDEADDDEDRQSRGDQIGARACPLGDLPEGDLPQGAQTRHRTASLKRSDSEGVVYAKWRSLPVS